MSRPTLPGSTLVYFIQGEKTGLIKIGQTTKNCPCERLVKGLQPWSPDTLHVLGVIHAVSDGKFHSQFHKDWHHGEWFNPSSELLDFIEHCTEKLTCDCLKKYDIGYVKQDKPIIMGRRPYLEAGGSALQTRHNNYHYRNPDERCLYCQKKAKRKNTSRSIKYWNQKHNGSVRGGRLGGIISSCVRGNLKKGLPCRCGYHKTIENKEVIENKNNS